MTNRIRKYWVRGAASIVTISSILFLQGCATNPVTGKREIVIISSDKEVRIGRQHYSPAQQSQGGLYNLDSELVTYIDSVGQRIADVSGRPGLPYEFVVLNNSVPNAWAMPGGKIAINRGLLIELNSEAELAAVLSHEIVHSAARHGAKALERGILFQGILWGVSIASEDHKDGQYALMGAQFASGLTQLKYSRKAESESDHYGTIYMAKAGYDPYAAVELQETFLRLKDGKRSSKFSTLFSSHPPSEKRIKKNRKTAGSLASGGRFGREEYKNKMAFIMKSLDGYKAYDEGVKALTKKNYQKALDSANAAIQIVKKESLFHGLKGDALTKLKVYPTALASYDQAISLNEGYYLHFLRRGQLKKTMGDTSGSKIDLGKSNVLLPTADAHYILGNIAQGEKRRQDAIHHFQEAASSKSETGIQAGINLAQLTLPQHPQKYLRISFYLDKRRDAMMTVRNKSPIPISHLNIEVWRTDNPNKKMSISHVPAIQPGKGMTFRTGLDSIPENSAGDKLLRARVTSVRVR